jgi:hypothetical protein
VNAHPNPEQRLRAESETKIDLHKKSIEQLLADIHDESVNASPNEAPLTRTLARFASLLAVLSRKADIAQRWMIAFTTILTVLTIVLAALTWAMLCKM